MYWCNTKKHVAFEHNHVAQESRMGSILTSFDNHFFDIGVQHFVTSL